MYFAEHYVELLRIAEERFGVRFPKLRELLMLSGAVEPSPLLEEALELMSLLLERDREMPRAYFFAILPRDFTDVVGLVLGGSSRVSVPTEEGSYELRGGLGRALLVRDGEVIRELREGDEVTVGGLRFRVFSRSCYEMAEGPLKTLIAFSLLAKRMRAVVAASSVPTQSIVWRGPRGLERRP
ncbi:MAG: hypothetical protein DRJ56_02325 [Thermoprotei archaeon]|nr:MAG: hypothetical protein DRJ56_02325 [Thermoprotei archaeon]